MPAYRDTERDTWYVQFRYMDMQGRSHKKKKRGFARKRDAVEWEREFLATATHSPEMSFASFTDLYLADARARLKASTCETKASIIQAHILPYFGTRKLSEITPVHVRQWQTDLLSKDFSATYIKTIHNQISAIFNHAVKYYNLKSNPAAKAGSVGKKRADEMHFWTLDEYRTFSAAIANEPLSFACFELLYWTGIRMGELRALTLADIDLEAGYIHIRKTLSGTQSDPIITEPKTPKSRRIVAIPNHLCACLRHYISMQYGLRPSDILLPITKSGLHHIMDRGCKISGAKRIRVHDLRHSHASLLIELGFSPLLIAERLGHENIQTTLETYAHLYPHKQGELITRLEAL